MSNKLFDLNLSSVLESTGTGFDCPATTLEVTVGDVLKQDEYVMETYFENENPTRGKELFGLIAYLEFLIQQGWTENDVKHFVNGFVDSDIHEVSQIDFNLVNGYTWEND